MAKRAECGADPAAPGQTLAVLAAPCFAGNPTVFLFQMTHTISISAGLGNPGDISMSPVALRTLALNCKKKKKGNKSKDRVRDLPVLGRKVQWFPGDAHGLPALARAETRPDPLMSVLPPILRQSPWGATPCLALLSGQRHDVQFHISLASTSTLCFPGELRAQCCLYPSPCWAPTSPNPMLGSAT